MAEKIPNYAGEAIFSDIVKNITTDMDKVDIDDPSKIFLDKDTSLMQILKIQSETHSETLRDICEYLKNVQPPAGETTDTAGLIAENAGDKVSVQAKKEFLDNIAKKNILRTRVLQKIEDEKEEKALGSYFDPTRETIIHIPETIATGTTDTISDSGLKLIGSFQGDSNVEAEKLKLFLRSVFDVAVTNNLNEAAVKKVLKRKLENTARKLIDRYEEQFVDKPDLPTLRQIVLKLEDRFCSEYQPQVANAKLSMYTKGQNQTYQALEADISELTTLAARGEDIANRKEWIKHKEIAVFKQAITDNDRKLIYRENQSRTLSNLPELSMSQMVDLLIKTYSEQNAFTTASNLKNQPRIGDSDSIQTITDQKSKRQKKKEQALLRKAAEENKKKEELFALYEQTQKTFSSNSRNRGRGRGGFQNRGRGRGGFQNSNQNFGGANGYSNNWKNGNNRNDNKMLTFQ